MNGPMRASSIGPSNQSTNGTNHLHRANVSISYSKHQIGQGRIIATSSARRRQTPTIRRGRTDEMMRHAKNERKTIDLEFDLHLCRVYNSRDGDDTDNNDHPTRTNGIMEGTRSFATWHIASHDSSETNCQRTWSSETRIYLSKVMMFCWIINNDRNGSHASFYH